MSCITENTVVLEMKDVEAFKSAYQENEEESRLNGLNEVFSDNRIAVFVFDCNGDPFFCTDGDFTPIILETNYGDDDLYTQKRNDEEDYLEDTEETAAALLEDMLPAEVYERVAEQIKYS